LSAATSAIERSCAIADEAATFDAIARASAAFGTLLAAEGDEASVALRP
jgi:hypothetical protein